MRCLFLSDAHYPISKRVIDFLLDKYTEFDSIYILGDLFEFYFGYNNFIYPHHLPLINALKFISNRVKVILFEGNHEYKLEKICDYIDIRVIKDGLIEKMGNYNVFMAHGDTIDKQDIAYRIFRSMLKNKFMLTFINTIPPDRLLCLSKLASKVSKENLKSKHYRGTEKAFEDFSEKLMYNGVDVVILGHTHNSTFKKIDKGLYLNTGEFFSNFSYVVFDGKQFELRYWR